MIYVVKCAYCGKTYILDTDENTTSFECRACKGSNGLKDVQEKFLNKEEMESDAARKRRVNKMWEDEGSIDAIKSFHMSEFPVKNGESDDGYGTESNYFSAEETAAYDAARPKRILMYIVFAVCILIIGLAVYSNYSAEKRIEEEVQRRMEEDEALDFMPIEWQREYFRKQVEEE